MINDYKCKNEKCQKEFEYMSIGSNDKPKCPECGSEDLEKQFPKKTSFQLKGSGWAKDKYGR